MTNIPRRLIYETMLELEEGIEFLHVAVLNEENFKKFSENFNLNYYEKLKQDYFQIIALFILFLKNQKFETKEELEAEVKKILKKKEEIKNQFPTDIKLFNDLKNISKNLEKDITKIPTLKTYQEGKKIYSDFVEFNHIIPEILTLRRDEI